MKFCNNLNKNSIVLVIFLFSTLSIHSTFAQGELVDLEDSGNLEDLGGLELYLNLDEENQSLDLGNEFLQFEKSVGFNTISSNTPDENSKIEEINHKNLVAKPTTNKQVYLVISNTYEEGLEFYEKRHYFKARIIFETYTNFNHPGAYNMLGDMYRYGIGVKMDRFNSLHLYLVAAQLGHDQAQNSLATLLLDGIDGRPDMESIIFWLNQSASQNNVRAQVNLGDLYSKINGVKGIRRDLDEALKWYRLAALQKDNYAIRRLHQLGNMYYYGKGVVQDYDKAVKIFKLAARSGVTASKLTLSKLYYDGTGVHQSREEGLKWLLEATTSGDPNVFYQLGKQYLIDGNFIFAHSWYNLAAAKGHREAISQRRKLERHMTRREVKKSQNVAQRCFKMNYTNCNFIPY